MTSTERMRTWSALGVFLVLFGSYAYFRHGRDWNTASRLMLTYALVDRGTLSINGLEDQTGDKAVQGGRFYSDKLPGYSFLATIPYAFERHVLGLPPHPLNRPGFAHWPADYGVTLFTSGLATAATGALLVLLCGRIGAGVRGSVLVGLAYGLATPAALYACLAYGHQTSAFCLLASFGLLHDLSRSGRKFDAALAGFLAAYASLVEIQVGPVSAILGLFLIAQVVGRRRPASGIVWFGLGALVPTLALLLYNHLAFGSPLTMGYFLHANPRFRGVHSAANPLGIASPRWELAGELLIGTRRGLFWYAPILVLAPIGWIRLLWKKEAATAIVCGLVAPAVFVMNLSYPEWTGGWSTGPRLLLPLIPFGMLLVGGALAGRSRGVLGAGIALFVIGATINLLFEGIGGRVPEQGFPVGGRDPFAFPLRDLVLPVWGGGKVPDWLYGQRYARNLASLVRPLWVESLAPARQWLQFAPLMLFQAVGATLLLVKAPSDGGEPVPRELPSDGGPDAVG